MKTETKEKNEDILAFVVKLGGGYVWEPEIFAVNLLESPIRDEEALVLRQLTGVEQIALNAASLSEAALNDIAMIPGLKSLVLSSPNISPEAVLRLGANGVDVQVL